MTIDFKKKQGHVTANGSVTKISGITVIQHVAKQQVVLQGLVKQDEVFYPTEQLSIPDHPRILEELIKKLTIIHQSMVVTRVH